MATLETTMTLATLSALYAGGVLSILACMLIPSLMPSAWDDSMGAFLPRELRDYRYGPGRRRQGSGLPQLEPLSLLTLASMAIIARHSATVSPEPMPRPTSTPSGSNRTTVHSRRSARQVTRLQRPRRALNQEPKARLASHGCSWATYDTLAMVRPVGALRKCGAADSRQVVALNPSIP